MNDNKLLVAAVILCLAMGALAWSYMSSDKEATFGAAPPGLASTAATSSDYLLAANTATALQPATTTCASRIVKTQNATLYLTLNGYTPTLSGAQVIQAASTSVVYDAGLYGCGVWKALSTGGQTITITETR